MAVGVLFNALATGLHQHHYLCLWVFINLAMIYLPSSGCWRVVDGAALVISGGDFDGGEQRTLLVAAQPSAF